MNDDGHQQSTKRPSACVALAEMAASTYAERPTLQEGQCLVYSASADYGKLVNLRGEWAVRGEHCYLVFQDLATAEVYCERRSRIAPEAVSTIIDDTGKVVREVFPDS